MLFFYRCLTFFLFPAFVFLIFLRLVFKKEDKIRFKEKIFYSSFRPNRNNNKKLIWFHAASIGEILSIVPLIEEINNFNKNIEFLITTVTLSSANLLEKIIYQRKQISITHRFFPLDTKRLAKKFLESWKPDLVCFVESEIWPNFLFTIKEKKIPLVLVNGRITKKTFNRWQIFPFFAKKTFNNFDLCLAASEESKNNLQKLQVKNLFYIGNLKFSVNFKLKNLDESNKKILDNFYTWCAVSTHEGEENVILKTHLEIKKKYEDTLTIIIPRHINRCSYIEALSKKFNLKSQILNDKDLINKNTEILIINSFGVLPKYFEYCKNIFIGKSLIKKLKHVGGQNPIEAAKLGCKIFHGPYFYNFQEIYDFLNTRGISEQINNENELAEKIIDNFKNVKKIKNQHVDLLNIHGKEILKETVKKINLFIK